MSIHIDEQRCRGIDVAEIRDGSVNAGVLWRFGLVRPAKPPEVANGVRLRWRCRVLTRFWSGRCRYAPVHEQALEARRRAGRKPQARMVARRVRPRLPDGRPRQGEGQAGLLPVLLGEEEAREADKARLALGPSARKEWGEAGRCLLPIGVILRILD